MTQTAAATSQQATSDPLTHFTQLMNTLLPAFDIADDPQPSAESRHDLLRDVRSIRDTYANERARTENQLVAAQQTVAALAAQLRMADQKLVTIEDLIGEVRVRMHTRGLATHPVVRRPPPKSIPPVTLSNCASPNANDYAVNTQSAPSPGGLVN